MALFGFLFCCRLTYDPVQHFPRWWRHTAGGNQILLILHFAFAVASAVWLWEIHTMEGSSIVRTLVGAFIFGRCLVQDFVDQW
jgi:hypothetical protein